MNKIVAFHVFLLMIVLIWITVLLVLKFYYGPQRVGCAAGGNVIDIKEMKKVYNLDKFERKHRILRNWRIQTTCLLTCLVMLPCTILMLKLGLDPFINSLHDIQQLNDHIDSHAYRGIQTVTQLQTALYDLQQQTHQLNLVESNFDIYTTCSNRSNRIISVLDDLPIPRIGKLNNMSSNVLTQNNNTSNEFDFLQFDWKSYQNQVFTSLTNLATFDLNTTNNILYHVTNGTAGMETSIDSLNSHDWIVRLFIVIIDVVVVYLIIGILLAKDNVDCPAYQSFTTYILLPIFFLSLIATITATCMFTTIAIVNAGMYIFPPMRYCFLGGLQSNVILVNRI
jgi:hypothetical protein